ncbi:MAG: hypothetical protein QGF00_22540 [Planctomycetota bacterium]|nr:hypothetical protein [Planctomycetota bacterium]MDP7252406.1 hypothetical protein [Planctomycetota bacterium]
MAGYFLYGQLHTGRMAGKLNILAFVIPVLLAVEAAKANKKLGERRKAEKSRADKRSGSRFKRL